MDILTHKYKFLNAYIALCKYMDEWSDEYIYQVHLFITSSVLTSTNL